MKAGNKVLVFNPEEHADFIRVVTIDEENIPEQLNGESGFHVYHVRMLTELILRRLQKTGKCDLSDQAVESISAAAAVHDIGKSKIPKGILDFPGKLSPLEYDIVKKHTTFGAQILEN